MGSPYTEQQDLPTLVKKIPNFDNLTFHEQEWIKCKLSFNYFASNYINILHPTQGLVKFNLYEYQTRCVREFEAHRFNIISKFRQGGLSTLAVLWSLWRCMFQKHQSILIISKTDSFAVEAGSIAKTAIENMKYENPWMLPNLSEDNKHRLEFSNTGSKMMFHTPASARGKAASLVIIDEAAFIQNMEEHWKSMYPVISTGGNVIVISTVNGRGNWYEIKYTDALNEKNQFNVIDLDYKEHPEYSKPGWEEATRANIGVKEFAQEYQRSFLGSGDTFISDIILADLAEQTRFVKPIRKLYEEWDSDLAEEEDLMIDGLNWAKGALHVYKEPQDGHEYLIGVDVARGMGEKADNSAIQIIDTSTLEQVGEFSSNIITPHMFAELIYTVGNYYNIATVVVESNGPGIAVLEQLELSHFYENLYYQVKRSSEKAGFTVSNTTRPVILESLQAHLQNGTVKINSKRLVKEMDTFIYNNKTRKVEAQSNCHDDLILSYALALYIRDQSHRDAPIGLTLVNESAVKINHSKTFEAIKLEMKKGILEDDIDPSSLKPKWEKDGDSELIIPDMQRPYDGISKEFGW